MIKEPEFDVVGPKRQKLALRFSPEKEKIQQEYFIFILLDQAPW